MDPPAFGAHVDFLLHENNFWHYKCIQNTKFSSILSLRRTIYFCQNPCSCEFWGLQSSWCSTWNPPDRLRVWAGLPGHFPSLYNLFSSIPLANFLLDSNWDSAGNLLARAREFNALTSETEQRKVNWRWGHHLACQTYSRPIGSCLLVLTSSTQCFELLWRDMGSV